MIFSSYVFLLGFLPLVLLGFLLLSIRNQPRLSLAWLLLSSLFFYAWWNPPFVALICGSIAFNYLAGRLIGFHRSRGSQRHASFALAAGVICNLGLIGYFKYAQFLADNLSWLAGVQLQTGSVFLPLGISFFTFQQIAYLVDARRGLADTYDPQRYALFVTFFPQLIAGPIVHHREMMPQFERSGALRPHADTFSLGLSVFAVGLMKKVILADSIAPLADQVFDGALAGQASGLRIAWGGALAYAFQLYFDFSGYSDMAVGLGLMFNIRLPLNFASPYKAPNIIEFWRRWHITLAQFLRDYVYIPLGGNRHGPWRRHTNLMITMLLGGLWHGAGWTFVAWGGLHGTYLVINHAWRSSGIGDAVGGVLPRRLRRFLAISITFLAVLIGWVFFRAESFAAAWLVLEGMAGVHGKGPRPAGAETVGLLLLALIAWGMPNTQTWCGLRPADSARPALARWYWRPSAAWASILALGCAAALMLLARELTSENPFLYFQF